MEDVTDIDNPIKNSYYYLGNGDATKTRYSSGIAAVSQPAESA
jgi:hypothetical protein